MLLTCALVLLLLSACSSCLYPSYSRNQWRDLADKLPRRHVVVSSSRGADSSHAARSPTERHATALKRGGHSDAADRVDLHIGLLGEAARLDDKLLFREVPLARDPHDPDDGRVLHVLLVVKPDLLNGLRPRLVGVDDGDDFAALDAVEVMHADVSKVSRMVLVEAVAATAWVLAVLDDAAPTFRFEI